MDSLLPDLSQLIESAVAPVFLLAGIAGFLNVMSARLGRITDRVRATETEFKEPKSEQILERSKLETKVLFQRMRTINWAIALCVAAGLMVCSVIMALFASALWVLDLEIAVVALFIMAMLFLVSSLLIFLLEIKLGTTSIRILRMNK